MDKLKFRAVTKYNKVYDGLIIENFDCGYCIPAGTMEVKIYLYTGLKDKNGKEIYEGDIVKYYNHIGTIDYYNAHYYIRNNGRQLNSDLSRSNEEVEIIGNIYENPDLITNQ